jgi:hypothetical protein
MHTASIIIVLMMEAIGISEMSVHFNVTTQRYIPEGSKLHARCCENMKSQTQDVIVLKF